MSKPEVEKMEMSDNQSDNISARIIDLTSSDSEVEFMYDSDGYSESDHVDLVSDGNEEEPLPQASTKKKTEQDTIKDSVFELLRELRQKRNEDIVVIITEQLTWLINCANANLECNNGTIPDAKDVYYVSCALWFCQELVCSKNVLSLLTTEAFDILLKWSLSLRCSSTLKRAIDRVLCSMYTLRPEMYVYLLEKLNIIMPFSPVNEPNGGSEMHYIFSHINCQNIFEPYDVQRLRNSSHLTMSKDAFSSLATISHSYMSSLQLINSGFLSLLVDVILDFCAEKYSGGNAEIKEVINSSTVSRILLFFSELCWEGTIRTWLGSDEIRIFWERLLNLLFKKRAHMGSLPELMDATVSFFSKCCWCYPKNNENLALIIKEIFTKMGKDDFTVFVRRFFLELVTATECIFVSVETDLPENMKTIWSISNNVPFPPPPGYPSWNKHQLLYLSTDYTCTEIISKVFDGDIQKEHSTQKTVFASSSKLDVDIDSSKKMKFEETEDTMPNLILWVPNEARFINVDQNLTISQMLFILISSGDTLESPLIKFLVTQKKPSTDENFGGWYERSFSLLHALVNIEAFVTIGNILTLHNPGYTNTSLNLPLLGMTPPLAHMNFHNSKPGSTGYLAGVSSQSNVYGSEIPTPSWLTKNMNATSGLQGTTSHPAASNPHLPMTTAGSLLNSFLTTHLQGSQPSSLLQDSLLLQTFNNPEFPGLLETKGNYFKPTPFSMKTKPGFTTDTLQYSDLKTSCSVMASKSQNNSNSISWKAMPLHSLLIFGQFLKIPDFRLQVEKKPILQSVMGLNSTETFDLIANKTFFVDDPKKLENPLAVLPFEILRSCFKMRRKCALWDTTNIRNVALKHGVIDITLTCLAVFTHKSDTLEDNAVNPQAALIMAIKQCNTVVQRQQAPAPVTKPCKKHYWPKGVGYGGDSGYEYDWSHGNSSTGTDYKHRLQLEEEHVTAVFHVLATYINSDFRLYDLYQNYMDEICDLKPEDVPELPEKFIDLIERSCLLTTLVDYLRNDSVLDILRHVPLYTAIMQLLRVMACNSQTVKFLITKNHTSSVSSKFTSLLELLQNMKIAADIYNSKFLTKKADNAAPGPSMISDNLEEDEEALILDIQITAIIINVITEKCTEGVKTNHENPKAPSPIPNPVSVEEQYLQIMKRLRFDSYDIISENEDILKFNVPYAFSAEVHRNGNTISHPSRMKRLAQESASLPTTLPLTNSSSVFVRCDTNRLDVMKVLITGPADTPYMNGCFIFDVYFPPDYPNSPMKVLLETTGNKKVRFNPNLYECGKVCLSLLNTWGGRPEEKWNAQTSSLLQVLISIQALILVSDPYFNEPGYQSSRGTATGTTASNAYNSRLLPNTINWAMIDPIRNPSPCFKEVIQTHFALKKEELIRQITKWIKDETNKTIQASLEKQFRKLHSDLLKLPMPPGI